MKKVLKYVIVGLSSLMFFAGCNIIKNNSSNSDDSNNSMNSLNQNNSNDSFNESSSFDVAEDNIGFDDTTRTVLSKLGDPDDEFDNTWIYLKYSSSSFYDKWNQMNTYFSTGKSSDYTKGEELYDELKETKCVLLYVQFDNDKKVSKCFKDTNWSYSLTEYNVHDDKTLSNVDVFDNPSVNYYYDGTLNNNISLNKNIDISYYSLFDDKSYCLAKAKATIELNNETSAEMNWSDEFYSYNKNNTNINKVGEISKKGIITKWNSEYDFPYGEYELSDDILNDESFYKESDNYYYIVFSHKVNDKNVNDRYLVKAKNIKEIIIDESVTYIKKGAFKDCNKVRSVIIEGPSSGWGSSKKYLTIEQQAFEGADNVSKIYLTGDLIIEGYAFDGAPNADLYFSLGTIYNGTVETYYKYYQYNLDGTKHNEYWGKSLSNFNAVKIDDIYNYYFNDKLIGSIAGKDTPEIDEISEELSYMINNELFNIGSVELIEYKEEDGEYNYKINYIYNGSYGMQLTINSNNCVINGYNGNGTDVVIPSKILVDGNKTINIIKIGDNAFKNNSSLTSITIPSSVTTIGYSAFSGCNSLTSITLPSSVTSIGSYAFYKCSSLTSITIPNSVTTIGEGAFSGCSSLTNVYYNGTIEDWCNITFNSASANPMSKASHFYMLDENNNYKEVTSIEIPSTITSVSDWQFFGFNNVTSITIPSSVTTIGEGAFSGCTSLKTITLPFIGGSKDSNKYLGYIFGASSYTSNSSYVPSSLKEVIILNGYTSIDSYAFYYCKYLTSITIPSSVTTIGYSAFSGCDSLTSITLPSSVTTIGYSAFSGCSSLTNVYYNGTIEDWCNITFNSASANPMSKASHFYMLDENNNYKEVTSIEIPSTITSIGDYQFYGFNNVTSIKIPSSVTSIGEWAFAGCDSLQYNEYDNGLYLGNNENPYLVLVKTKDTSITSCIINENARFIYSYAFYNCSKLTTVIFEENSQLESIGDYAFYDCSKLTSIIIPSSVTTIENSAFSGCNSLTSITLPSSVTSIGSYAFYKCSSLTSITIPNSVTTIRECAFSGCSSLTNVYYNGTIEDWCNITFSNEYSNPMCYASHFYMLDENNNYKEVTSIEIPSTVTSICKYQFFGFNNVTSITIPSSVTTIGKYAFSRCNSLTIYCEVSSKPSGWDSYWNSSNCPVVWGYTIE